MKRVGPGATQQEGLNFWHHDGGGGPHMSIVTAVYQPFLPSSLFLVRSQLSPLVLQLPSVSMENYFYRNFSLLEVKAV